MFKNKGRDGALNICGKNIAKIRKGIVSVLSQRALADKMQLSGIDLDKNAIQKIEAGQRFITDIELAAFARVLNVTLEALYFFCGRIVLLREAEPIPICLRAI